MIKTIDLCGTWQIKGATSYRGGYFDWPTKEQPFVPSYPAKVPGTVQEAFEHITGNLYIEHNVYNAAFIEGQYWLFSRTFELSEEDFNNGRIRLTFEGLDLFAAVFVNGKYLGYHNNFYTPAKFDITDAAKIGVNKLDVKLDCGLYGTKDKDSSWSVGTHTGMMLDTVWARKPQSSYEWDWSPRLINVGIPKPCYLEFSNVFVEETAVYHTLSRDYSEANINVRQYLTNCCANAKNVRVDAVITETGDKAICELSAEKSCCANMNITVKNPKLWYPRNYGEQFMYTLTVTVTDVDSGNILGEITKKVGLRHIEIDTSRREAGGRYFRLLVNGIRVFAKGGNIVPHDILFSRFSRESYEVLIERAVENNFNALRVWGGGIYESDDFYDLCDYYGIVVWQDFIGACATYPAFDKDFVENYISEVRHNVRRMSSHASLAMYCGNNEIEQAFTGTNPEMLAKYRDASLYYVVLPHVLHEEGDHHYYQPTSPWSPDGANPMSFESGDQHPWTIGFSNHDYFGYRQMDCRFPNEGGILGPTSLPNIMYALGENQRYMHSFDYKVHDNSIADYADCAPEHMLYEKLGMSIERGGISIPDYVYYGGFIQGEGLTEYILNFRRRMNDTTGSAIFWMFNDCWPATRSWTTVDYLRNRTPSFYPVKRAFSPITVDIVKTEKGFDVYGINEYVGERRAKLTYGYATADKTTVIGESEVTLESNNSCIVATLDASALPENAVPFAELSVDGEPLARRRFVDVPYNTLGLSEGKISVTKNADGTVTYLSDKLVLGVCIDLDGDDGNISDNFFDLYPGRAYTVNPGSKSGEILYCYFGQKL
ncbi:MAG: hypothetical protein IKU43_06875 [Clostridia bacterium]|nr:hypothetical protein [Clostridia bacterium]